MNDEGLERRAERDRLLRPDAGAPAAHRRRASEADAANSARRWHHARWIAINLVLIAFTGCLYAKFLIPSYVVGATSATRVAPDVWIADKYDELSSAAEEEAAFNQSSPGTTSTESKRLLIKSASGCAASNSNHDLPLRTDMPEPGSGARKKEARRLPLHRWSRVHRRTYEDRYHRAGHRDGLSGPGFNG